jgi:hypothetical protein
MKNIQEEVNRIQSMMGIINESVEVNTIKNINWWALHSGGIDFLRKNLRETIRIPAEFQPVINNLISSILHELRDSVEKDVMSGTLSNNTINLVNNNIINAINKNSGVLDTIFGKLSFFEKKLAKTVGQDKISNSINEGLNLVGDKLFIEGMVSKLKEIYDVNSPIVKNYIKVVTQLGNSMKNNQKIKTHIMNVILSKL